MEDNILEIPEKKPIFSDKALRALIGPLIVERFLDMAVGMADTLMVSSVGEAAVSGVALVDTLNNLVLFVLAALATGGAVVVSQYIGKDEMQNARTAAKQLLYLTIVSSILLMSVLLIWRDPLLNLIFGAIDSDVMEHAKVYCTIMVISYPFMGITNSIAALYRSMGNSKLTMTVSLGMNLLNIGGNAIFIYGMGMGVAGAALSSLIARVVSAVVMLVLIHNPRNPVFIYKLYKLELRPLMVKNILRIGIPSGLENGMFHIGKLALQRLVASMGTVAIAANAASGQITNMAFVPGSAISLALITVVGQCMGAGEHKQASAYTKRMLRMIMLLQGGLCLLVLLFAPQFMSIFHLSPEATELGTLVMRVMALPLTFIWPFAFPLANTLRASGDVRFPMVVSVASMWIFRIGASYLAEYLFHFGLMSIYVGTYMDWVARAIIYSARYKGGKWRTMKVV